MMEKTIERREFRQTFLQRINGQLTCFIHSQFCSFLGVDTALFDL